MPRNWFSVKALATGGAEIDIYDEIGFWGVRAKDFIGQVREKAPSGDLTVNINSPGGEVFDALTIYNFLKRRDGQCHVRVDGIAASAASVIAMAGDLVEMPENAFMMIHDPWGVVIGDADEMRDYADTLDKMSGSLIACYRDKSGMDDDKIRDLMRGDTWITAAEAVEMGLADEMSAPVQIAASIGAKVEQKYRNVPAALAARTEPGSPPETVAKESPMTTDKTKPEAGADAANVVDLDKARSDARLEAQGEFQARAKSISQLCALAGCPAKVGEFIASDKTVDQIQNELVEAKASGAGQELSGRHAPSDANEPADIDESWAKAYARYAPNDGKPIGYRM